jgi:glycosyltransferase involved in cell wall biosynthesis
MEPDPSLLRSLPTTPIRSSILSRPARFQTTPLVAAIIPAYNEARGIGKVLNILRQVDLLSEIIVIDDGSKDRTIDEIEKCAVMDYRIRTISHSENRGKGEAIFSGWRATRAPLLVTLDADLVGLKPEQVVGLILPVLEMRADMTLGLFRHGYWRTEYSHRVTPWLTGQRCFRADLLKSISLPAAAGYGFETAITVAARRHKWRCVRVSLEGVSHPPSESHRGFWNGVATRSKMYAQIVRAWYVANGWERKVARLKHWASLVFDL